MPRYVRIQVLHSPAKNIFITDGGVPLEDPPNTFGAAEVHFVRVKVYSLDTQPMGACIGLGVVFFFNLVVLGEVRSS